MGSVWPGRTVFTANTPAQHRQPFVAAREDAVQGKDSIKRNRRALEGAAIADEAL
jgi:hypothetical protein